MKRRGLVAGIGASICLAGCIDGDPIEGGEGNAGDETPENGDGDDTVTEDPRVDTPPYPIERPDPGGEDGYDEGYLGENMPTEPSLGVERLPIAAGGIRDGSLRELIGSGEDAYRLRLVEAESEVEEVFDTDAMDDDAADRLRGVGFDEAVVVVVESGFGSGSVRHRWGRAEDGGSTLDLHGYYTDPVVQTDDVTSRLSVLEVGRPEEGPDYARMRLTVAPDRRVNVNSTEGVVTVER